jgi:hypothetical protein
MITPTKGLIHIAMIFALLAGVAFASQSQATVLRVIVVQTDNTSGYVKEIAKGQAITKRLGSSAVLRVWRARFAGRDTGTVVVSIEYSSLATLAQDEAKTLADPEYSAWLSGLDKIRKIVSDSTYDELKP